MAEHLVLIVDDDPVVQAQLAAGFLARGYQVETASNGKEALQILERVRPALCCSTWRCPFSTAGDLSASCVLVAFGFRWCC